MLIVQNMQNLGLIAKMDFIQIGDSQLPQIKSLKWMSFQTVPEYDLVVYAQSNGNSPRT